MHSIIYTSLYIDSTSISGYLEVVELNWILICVSKIHIKNVVVLLRQTNIKNTEKSKSPLLEFL